MKITKRTMVEINVDDVYAAIDQYVRRMNPELLGALSLYDITFMLSQHYTPTEVVSLRYDIKDKEE